MVPSLGEIKQNKFNHSFPNLDVISFVLFLQASEQSSNFNISKMAYWSPILKAAEINESSVNFYIPLIP